MSHQRMNEERNNEKVGDIEDTVLNEKSNSRPPCPEVKKYNNT